MQEDVTGHDNWKTVCFPSPSSHLNIWLLFAIQTSVSGMLLFWEVNLMHSYARKADNSYLWQTELMIPWKESRVLGFFPISEKQKNGTVQGPFWCFFIFFGWGNYLISWNDILIRKNAARLSEGVVNCALSKDMLASEIISKYLENRATLV